MTKTQKHKAICEAMEYIDEEQAKKRSLRSDIYIIKDTTAEEVKKLLIDIIYDENIGGKQDLSYEIVAKACGVIESVELDELTEDTDFEVDESSVYTAERLSYLNNNNEGEIMSVLREYDAESINLACAIWYDNMVRDVAYKLKDYILN